MIRKQWVAKKVIDCSCFDLSSGAKWSWAVPERRVGYMKWVCLMGGTTQGSSAWKQAKCIFIWGVGTHHKRKTEHSVLASPSGSLLQPSCGTVQPAVVMGASLYYAGHVGASCCPLCSWYNSCALFHKSWAMSCCRQDCWLCFLLSL